MQKRRIVFSVTISYDTPVSKIRKIPGLLEEIVRSDDRVEFDRSHFKALSDYWLDFEVVYIVKSSDYTIYMDIQQEYNFQILERLSEMDVEIRSEERRVGKAGSCRSATGRGARD